MVKITGPTLVSLLVIALWNSVSAAGDWEIKLELENTFAENEDRATSIEPTIRYITETWLTHLEYEKPVSPNSEDGKIEWQLEFYGELNQSEFAIRNEVTWNLEKNRTRSELTPRWYYNKSKVLDIGFDLEIDYYDSAADSEFDLFEVEIEPTIIWTKNLDNGKFKTKLEAPVFRLYSNEDGEDNFKYRGLEVNLQYQRKLTSDSRFIIELKLPYDSESNELEVDLNFALRHRF